MCMNTPDVPKPQIATESSVAKMPTDQMAGQAGSMQRNKQRAAASTILTSGSGVMSPASTQKKTLLGA
jgi:hypothetical protein